ncbi:MAG: phosphatidate cytidylyltransferase [Rhodospirillales bacterium]|nr:phosphatidate cytidylyltransferase [Rhodospirillales bacterium]MCW8953171.1 phosphatidate cytidylyltransferase [Rhodospirillales bacterium]MCW8969642.1 phosphatidate cytidylyltransferase [Rhodospirillales bacterium]MCW9001098.1 phosphatidate cytidylyltransferase [Rhodospirillales bacterium]
MDNKHSGGLKARIFAALVLAPPVLAAFFFGSPWFEALVVLASAILAWEWSRICRAGSAAGIADYTVIAAVIASVALGAAGRYDLAFVVTAIATAGGYFLSLRQGVGSAVWLASGVPYVVVPCLALVWLRVDIPSGREIVLWVLLIVWATDIGAYAFGKMIGGPKILPSVSPKKTWAGLIGGMICAGAIGALMAWVMGGSEAIFTVIVLSAAMAVLSQAGDFFESALKRRFGAKDASNLIPGHGGLMDRVDGLLAVSVAVALIKISGLDGGIPWL